MIGPFTGAEEKHFPAGQVEEAINGLVSGGEDHGR
jgi:hypothetical protein